jgi:hypothetical protein
MPGVGHFPMMEDAPAFNRILVEVVNGFDSARVNEDACTSR